ncbi:MAG: transcription antitermination factor NusB [Acidimicrobiales bacterium]
MSDRPDHGGGRPKPGRNGAGRARKKPGKKKRPSGRGPVVGAASRKLAIDLLVRVERDGAFVNAAVPAALDGSDLGAADRRFVTELVYGTTRMRRACDHLVDRFLLGEVEPPIRAALRVGTYQLVYLDTPPHAAVAATVGAVTGRGRSVVNAVLRKVAAAPVEFPDRATELSYPNWIVRRLTEELGGAEADTALRVMNRPVETARRDDGYTQDRASHLVVAAVGAGPDDLVIDTCAAPGGKATGLALSGARVVAGDVRPARLRTAARTVARLGADVDLLIADGRHLPIRPGVADRVLVDAPCSGLGSLRRRADARWRIDDAAPERLAQLQIELVLAGLELLRPGGELTYSVCTLTGVESRGVLDAVAARSNSSVIDPPGLPWLSRGPVATLLPDGGDGMMLFRLRRPD